MKLTGEQVRSLNEISDGAIVFVTKTKGQDSIRVRRDEDSLTVSVHADGTETILHEADNA